MTETSSRASWFPRKIDGPATELSLFDWPSIWKLLERPRKPLEENPTPLVLLKLAEPVSATPGRNRAKLSKPPPVGRSATALVSKVFVTCPVVVSITGADSITSTVSPPADANSALIVARDVSLAAWTTTCETWTLRKPFPSTLTL